MAARAVRYHPFSSLPIAGFPFFVLFLQRVHYIGITIRRGRKIRYSRLYRHDERRRRGRRKMAAAEHIYISASGHFLASGDGGWLLHIPLYFLELHITAYFPASFGSMTWANCALPHTGSHGTCVGLVCDSRSVSLALLERVHLWQALVWRFQGIVEQEPSSMESLITLTSDFGCPLP